MPVTSPLPSGCDAACAIKSFPTQLHVEATGKAIASPDTASHVLTLGGSKPSPDG